MKIIRRLEDLPHGLYWPVATIGNFDGMHLGHRELVRCLVRRTAETGGTATVVTFHPHPLQVLAPGNAPRQIQTLDQKLADLEALGVRLTVVIPFTMELARMSAREFATRIVWELLGLREIYVGPNFAFGHRREGSFALLKEFGLELGFTVGRIPQVQFRGSRVSSTSVRQALMSGNVGLARRLLGRPYALSGDIVHGTHTGTSLSVPTANLRAGNELVPRRGVYVSRMSIGGEALPGVTNIGYRPTVELSGSLPVLSIETHVLGLDRSLYGEKAVLEFLVRLRDERRFDGTPALVDQIRKDIGRARRYFEHWGNAGRERKGSS